MNIRYDLLSHLGSYTNIMWLLLVLERKIGKEIPESSRLEFLQNVLANNFALSDAEDNTTRPVNRRGIAHLPLLRILLAKSQKPKAPRA